MKIVMARLVVRSFEEINTNIQSGSPTCKKDSIRLVFSLFASLGWICHSLDIETAFLQGDCIRQDIWLRPPVEFNNGKLGKLKKTVYDLNDAARAYHFSVRITFLHLGATMCSVNQALFILS